jgi:hypothetical protein
MSEVDILLMSEHVKLGPYGHHTQSIRKLDFQDSVDILRK